MKKTRSSDDREVAELLKKLQASFLDKTEKAEKATEKARRKQEADDDDRKFREQLSAILNKAAANKQPAKKNKPKPKTDNPVSPLTKEQQPNEAAVPIPVARESKKETPAPKAKKKSSPVPQKSIAEPEVIVEPEIIAEPEIIVEPKIIAEPEIIVEPEIIAEPKVIVEPEIIAEPEVILNKPKNEPIVIRPRAYTSEKGNPEAKQTDRIVIRPPSPRKQGEAIVIRPRNSHTDSPTPQRVREQLAKTPIKIGKEILPENQRKQIPDPSEKPKPIMKKEQNTTFIPPSPADTQPANQTPRVVARGPVTAPQKPSVTTQATQKTGKSSDDPPRGASNKAIPQKNGPKTGQRRGYLQRLKLEKKLAEERKRASLALIHKKSGLSDDDIAMMFELGYENELRDLVGDEDLKRLRTEHLKAIGQSQHKHYRMAYGYRGEEYAEGDQRDSVIASYLHDRKQLLLQTVFTALLTVLLLFIDFPALVGASLLQIDTATPWLLPAMGLVLLALACLLSKRAISAGLRSFLKFSATPYSTVGIVAPLGVLYSAFTLLSPVDMPHINAVVCAYLLIVTCCDLLRLCSELRVFRLVSAEGEKNVLCPDTPHKKKITKNGKTVQIINDDLGENLYRVRKSTQCVGFFRRCNNMHSATRPFTITLVLMLALSVAVAFADAVYSHSILSALGAAIKTLLICAPISSVVGYFYPNCRANRLLFKQECALIGEESAHEFEAPKTVIFSDGDLISAKTQAEIAVQDGDLLRIDLRLAGILFRKLGGALGTVSPKLSGGQADPPVSILHISKVGVSAMIDNRSHLLLGNAEFLQSEGVRVPKESTDRALRRAPDTELLYVAVDGVLKLSYEIAYRIGAETENLIRTLANTDTAVAVISYDPNLNDRFLGKLRPRSAERIEVIKPEQFEAAKAIEIADTGAISLGDAVDIALPLYAAAGISRLRRFGLRVQVIASILGGTVLAALSLSGLADSLGPIPILIYQLFWTGVGVLASWAELNMQSLGIDKDKKQNGGCCT